VVDLLQKTNQFNVTTRRHTAAEVSQMAKDGSWGIFTLQSSDRFGDNGIVGLAMVQARKGAAWIDTFLLSCRVIGRGLETAILSRVADWARQQQLQTLIGEFIPTPKNAPAADFYARHGFVAAGEEGSTKLWKFELNGQGVNWPQHVGEQ
jgi:FkbH-like protein